MHYTGSKGFKGYEWVDPYFTIEETQECNCLCYKVKSEGMIFANFPYANVRNYLTVDFPIPYDGVMTKELYGITFHAEVLVSFWGRYNLWRALHKLGWIVAPPPYRDMLTGAIFECDKDGMHARVNTIAATLDNPPKAFVRINGASSNAFLVGSVDETMMRLLRAAHGLSNSFLTEASSLTEAAANIQRVFEFDAASPELEPVGRIA